MIAGGPHGPPPIRENTATSSLADMYLRFTNISAKPAFGVRLGSPLYAWIFWSPRPCTTFHAYSTCAVEAAHVRAQKRNVRTCSGARSTTAIAKGVENVSSFWGSA